MRTFASNWTGSGAITGAGDAERIEMQAGQMMTSETVNTGAQLVVLLTNVYAEGDAVTVMYRHGATQPDCESAGWLAYTVPFTSLGYVQIRLVVPS